MKKFTKMNFRQKIIIILAIVILISNFIVPTYSYADIGGVIMDPVVDFVCGIGDAIINVLQVCLMGDGVGVKDFSIGDGGFLQSAENFNDWDSSINSGNADETIDPLDEKKGFNRTLITGKVEDYYVPVAIYSPEQIFTGSVPGLDINFISPSSTEDVNIAHNLQNTIASWYVALRNLSAVGLMCVLVYVGIRMLLSSTAGDKAKYKQMFMDWLIALCLVFFLHYIMSFVLTLVESITQALSGDGTETYTIYVEGKGGLKTNLLGAARFKTQYNNFGSKMAYFIMYLALVFYTLRFTWFYLKRVLMMAFLTMIAPLVALTYPIDKISDGTAQAFNSWLKEYVFNALIQPFHLIIYTVFVTSAMDLASTNIIYTIVALGFIMEAEKILRKFFGFEKAGAGTLGALAGGAAAASALRGLGQKAKGAIPGKGNNGSSSEEGEKPVRFERKHDVSQIEANNNLDDNSVQESDENQNGTTDAMLDAYDENYGTEDWDAAERDRMAREAYANDEGMQYSDDEYRAILRDSGYSEEEIAQMTGNNTTGENGQEDQSNQEQIRLQQEEQNARATDGEPKKNSKIKNWARAHNINARSIAKGVGKTGIKAIGGVAKFGTKTAFRLAAGAIPAAVVAASGGGLTGAAGAFAVASQAGARAADAVINPVSRAGNNILNGNMMNGIRRQLDLANGNTAHQDRAAVKAFQKDQNNLNYLRDYMADKNNGNMPSAKEVREQMKSFTPYLDEGMTDIKDIISAQKVSKDYGIDEKQSAIIAQIGQERGITKDVLSDEKKAASAQANLEQSFLNKGYSEQQAKKQADYTINVLKAQNGVKHNLRRTQALNSGQQTDANRNASE